MDRTSFGEPNLGIERSISGLSSRKEKKSNNRDKPKQPRRGLGVAQLEKIRLKTQLDHGTFYPYNLNQFTIKKVLVTQEEILMFTKTDPGGYISKLKDLMGLRRLKIENIAIDNLQSSTTLRWSPGKEIIDDKQFIDSKSSTSRQFMNLQVAEEEQTRRKRNEMTLSSNQNLKTSDYEELDLELRLSI